MQLRLFDGCRLVVKFSRTTNKIVSIRPRARADDIQGTVQSEDTT
jgi:hypothetical protein